MGGCVSSISDYSSRGPPYAYVVTANGQLLQYSAAVTVSEVLLSETQSPDSFFLCNSDRLNFDDFIPSLEPQEELQPAQIYFMLPKIKLQYRLTASEMAALAVKASVALEQINHRHRKSKARISPVLTAEEDPQLIRQVTVNDINNRYRNYKSSGSVRKLARYSSRGAKLAIRSFRIRLNTINDGSVLVN